MVGVCEGDMIRPREVCGTREWPRPASRSVVVVDDDAGIRDTLSFILDDAGIETHTAADGIDGLELIVRMHPLAAVLDVRMPRMSGAELCRLVRATPSVAGMGIALMSAADCRDTERLAREIAADACLEKPFEPDVLIEIVTTMLRARMGMLIPESRGR